MARKERDNGATKQPVKIYSVGIYARLSVDSDERKNESIETQTEIAKAFISKQSDMVLYDCYWDLGRTGTNFKRDGFERMMQDVRMRKIDCIVVKDLSRFGRNHIETGNYIEKIFPFMGVRFVAVTDDFDSLHLYGEGDTLPLNLKNLVNEMYVKDIAVKVKSSRKASWEQGSYTGGVPPYGYMAEWVNGKKCLLVEENTAEIVRKIYELFLAGKNMNQIVVWLYEQRIVRPTVYRATGKVHCEAEMMLQQWSKGTVKMILTNPVYMGHLVQGRTCGRNDRMRHRQDIDSEDWAIREHTHQAIVSEDIFFQVAAKFEKSSVYCNKGGYSKTVPVEEDIYVGTLFCGDCGAKLTRTTAIKEFSSGQRIRSYSYNCIRSGRIDKNNCVTKCIALTGLNTIVKKAIRQEFSLSAMRMKDIEQRVAIEAEHEKAERAKELLRLEKKIEHLKRRCSEEYAGYCMGEIQVNAFKRIKAEKDKQIALIHKQCEEITRKQELIDCEAAEKARLLKALVKGSERCELTKEVVGTLIHRIEVYSDKRVKIIFAFGRRDCSRESGEINS